MLSAQEKRHRKTPEYRKLLREYQRRYRQKPEVKEKDREWHKKRYQAYVEKFVKTWGEVNRQGKRKPKKEVHRY